MTVELLREKTLSVMRYDRVQSILESVPALKEFLGPKDYEIIKRNKEKHYYSRGVVIVAHALHVQGSDPHLAPRALVLQLAVDLLRDKRLALKPDAEPKPKSEIEAQAEATPDKERKQSDEAKAKPERKKRAKKPSQETAAQSVEQAKKPSQETAAQSVEQAPPVPLAATAAADAPVATCVPLAATVAPEVTKAKSDQNSSVASSSISTTPVPTVATPVPTVATPDHKTGYVYYPYGTALSLALMLYKSLEIGDRMPGAEARLEASSSMIDMLKPLASTGIPMPEDFALALNHAPNRKS